MPSSRVQKIVPALVRQRRVAMEMLTQVKFDLGKLEAAFDGR